MAVRAHGVGEHVKRVFMSGGKGDGKAAISDSILQRENIISCQIFRGFGLLLSLWLRGCRSLLLRSRLLAGNRDIHVGRQLLSGPVHVHDRTVN